MFRRIPFKPILILFFAIGIFSNLVTPGFCEEAKFVIFHTSDIHGHISAHPSPTSKETPKPLVGGFAILKNCIDYEKRLPENKDARFFYFDCGDLFQGTPVVNKTKGKVMVDMMNLMGLSAMTLGNHDFDYTYENLIAQSKRKKYPIICCNVFDKRTGRLPKMLTPFKIFAYKGKRLGVIGVNTPSTPAMSVAANVKDVIFKDPAPILNKIIAKMKASKVDYIVVLSHLAYDQDLLLAKKVRGIDLILGGHSHTLKTKITYSGPDDTAIVHSGSHAEYTSKVTVKIEDDAPISVSMNSILLEKSKFGENPIIKATEVEYLKELNKEMSKVIAKSNVNLHRGVCGGDSPLGSVISDSMRESSGSDFAFINFGGIRESIFKGNITVGNIFKVQPFDNTIEVITMPGKDVINLVEIALSNPFTKMGTDDINYALNHFNLKIDGYMRVVGPKHGYLYPSNLIIKFDPSKEPMNRIMTITDGKGKPLDKKKQYTVAFNDFMSNGGDGYEILKDYKVRKHTYILVRTALMEKVKKLKTLQDMPTKRMNNIKLHGQFL